MATQPHSDRWSFRHAFQAARNVRRAEFGRQAIATIRPRGVVGFARRRAPLAIMLYLASWEGRLCWQDLDGFAVIEPPVRAGAGRGQALEGGAGARLLRLIDRRWDTVLFGAPLAIMLLASAVTAGFAPLRAAAPWCAAVTASYLFALVVARAVAALAWLAGFTELSQLGALDRTERVAGVRPADHWSMSLCHQTRPERTDQLMRQAAPRLIDQVRAHAPQAAQAPPRLR